MSMGSFPFGRMTKGVKWLLIINALLFVLQQVLPGRLESYLGLVPVMVIGNFHLWRIFTYMFLHGSFFHLLVNMFSIWMFGREIENVWGTREFLKFYFLCGLGTALMNTAFEPFSAFTILGATGAVYGLLVAFAMVFPESVIYLYGIIPMSARNFAALICVVEFLASFNGVSTLLARVGHLGGMLTGYIYLKSYEFRSFLDRLYHKIIGHFFVTKYSGGGSGEMDEDGIVREVDRILDKVSKQGAASLTKDEKEIMRRYSSMKH